MTRVFTFVGGNHNLNHNSDSFILYLSLDVVEVGDEVSLGEDVFGEGARGAPRAVALEQVALVHRESE